MTTPRLARVMIVSAFVIAAATVFPAPGWSGSDANTVLTGAPPAAFGGDTVRTPLAGSATRTAVLDALRRKLGVRSRFKVTFMRANERWAFVRCVEVVDDGGVLQETDLDVAALLEKGGTAGTSPWAVADLWTLSDNEERPYARFARQVRARVARERIPKMLFPEGFLTSDVPVE